MKSENFHDEDQKFTIDEFKDAARKEIDRWEKKWTDKDWAYYGFACAVCSLLEKSTTQTPHP